MFSFCYVSPKSARQPVQAGRLHMLNDSKIIIYADKESASLAGF
jgi:hypothetical protein